MPLRRTFFRFIRSKLGFTFVVILVLALFLVMLNAYTTKDLGSDTVDSGPRRGLHGFVDEEGVFHRGRLHGKHGRHGHKDSANMAVPVCQIPTLTLENDANKHAYQDLEPLECNGDMLFYMKNGRLSLNQTVLRGRKLNRCEYRGIEWSSDQFYQETKTFIQREAPFEKDILHDFFRVSCYLERTAGAKRKLLASDVENGKLSEKEREVIAAAEEAKQNSYDV